MLTQNFLFGLNLISLAGFTLMGIGLTMSRQKRIGAATAVTLMATGTALLFAGIYTAAP